MNTLLWAGLAANALAHLRMAVLDVQDGTDRVADGADPSDWYHWGPGGRGIRLVITLTVFSPILTAYTAGKFLLFPRGVKSKYAKEREAAAVAEAEAELQKEKDAAFFTTFQEAEAIVRSWNPGEVLLQPEPEREPEPEQVALGWHSAADAFDSAAKLIKETAGQPWNHPRPPRQRRIRATVGAADGLDWNEEAA